LESEKRSNRNKTITCRRIRRSFNATAALDSSHAHTIRLEPVKFFQFKFKKEPQKKKKKQKKKKIYKLIKKKK